MAETKRSVDVEDKIRKQPEAQSEGGVVCETRANGDVEDEADIEDEADGFISDYFKPSQGTYRPRDSEKESWGTDLDQISESDDQHDMLHHLVKSTAPQNRWREGLRYILKDNQSEISLRKCLTFLHSNVVNGIEATKHGCGKFVHIEDKSAPECLACPDWLTVIEGLNFDVTSPGTVRNIHHVDVVISKKSDKDALTGFCYLMKALLDMSLTNLQTISRLEEKDGHFLYSTLTMLCSGCGIDESDRPFLDDLENKYPFLITSLGFRRTSKQTKLQWQLPSPDKEFRNLCFAVHGLFRLADESVL